MTEPRTRIQIVRLSSPCWCSTTSGRVTLAVLWAASCVLVGNLLAVARWGQ